MKATFVDCEEVLYCDLCGNNRIKSVDKEGCIVQCRGCGLKFVNPRSKQTDISKIYDWNYENCPGWEKINPEAEFVYARKIQFVEQFIREGKILDIGAGRGEFLSKAKQGGKRQCVGTETSQSAVKYAKEKFGINLLLGQFEELEFPAQSFDAITFWHVLEHLPFPSRAIKEAALVLKDKGFLFVAVPNDSWLGRRHFLKNTFKKGINRLLIKKKLKLKKMYPEINEKGNKHLFYFTPRTLTKLLEKYGFRVMKRSVDYNYGEEAAAIIRRYRFELLFCRLTGINLSNSILIAAQKQAM